jgi:hypothetical protein
MESMSSNIYVSQKYVRYGVVYILSQVLESEVCLINLESGNRFNDPFKVKDIDDISIDEWMDIADRENVKLNLWSRYYGEDFSRI